VAFDPTDLGVGCIEGRPHGETGSRIPSLSSRRKPGKSLGVEHEFRNTFQLLESGYIVHPPFFGVELASTFSVRIKLFLALSYRQEPLPSFDDFTPLQSTDARSGRVKTVSLEFKRASTPDFECHGSLPDM
jgi:hypothetical protein